MLLHCRRYPPLDFERQLNRCYAGRPTTRTSSDDYSENNRVDRRSTSEPEGMPATRHYRSSYTSECSSGGTRTRHARGAEARDSGGSLPPRAAFHSGYHGEPSGPPAGPLLITRSRHRNAGLGRRRDLYFPRTWRRSHPVSLSARLEHAKLQANGTWYGMLLQVGGQSLADSSIDVSRLTFVRVTSAAPGDTSCCPSTPPLYAFNRRLHVTPRD